MGKKDGYKEDKHKKDQKDKHGNGKGPKEKCCEKYKKKGKHCSRCPLVATCPLPGEAP